MQYQCDIINSLTEHKKNYKLTNPFLMDCYAGLYPASLTKISLVLFNLLLSTRKYYKPDSQHYNEDEERRIYTNVLIKPSDILFRCHPTKYCLDNKEIDSDLGNLVKKINEIDDLNLFYIWKCGYPHVYIFIMERDIAVWKFYNAKAFVTPKTLLKIINSNAGIINSMNSLLVQTKQEVPLKDVHKSFGLFFNRMISKMNPDISCKIPLWVDNLDIKEYISKVVMVLKGMDMYEGLVIDNDFINRLPPNVSEKIKKDHPMTQNEMNLLEKELVPQDCSIVRTHKVRAKKIKVDNVANTSKLNDVKTEMSTFDSLDPFLNCNNLISFYRKMISSFDINAKFFDFSVDRKEATELLDLLIKNNRNNDIMFLKSWIKYYATMYLKGNYIYDRQKTSIKIFRESFSTYNAKYVS